MNSPEKPYTHKHKHTHTHAHPKIITGKCTDFKKQIKLKIHNSLREQNIYI